VQLTFSRSCLNRPHVPRPGVWRAAAVILVTAWSGLPTTVSAQSNPLPQMNVQGPMNAPIGHRQPRAQDLPPDVLRAEGMNRQPPEPAPAMRPNELRDPGRRNAGRLPFGDAELQICRQC
jgi:hypothetical protein